MAYHIDGIQHRSIDYQRMEIKRAHEMSVYHCAEGSCASAARAVKAGQSIKYAGNIIFGKNIEIPDRSHKHKKEECYESCHIKLFFKIKFFESCYQ